MLPHRLARSLFYHLPTPSIIGATNVVLSFPHYYQARCYLAEVLVHFEGKESAHYVISGRHHERRATNRHTTQAFSLLLHHEHRHSDCSLYQMKEEPFSVTLSLPFAIAAEK